MKQRLNDLLKKGFVSVGKILLTFCLFIAATAVVERAKGDNIPLFPPSNLSSGGCNADTALMFDGTDAVRCGNPLPSGAVMAFNLPNCPAGWSPFAGVNGRTIIGTGNSGAAGATNHGYGQTGGEETHVLTVFEMPAHSHTTDGDFVDTPGAPYKAFQYIQTNGPSNGGIGPLSFAPDPSGGAYGQPPFPQGGPGITGGDGPHNTMMPYIALTYCSKD